ncbi:MAG: ATP-binding protein [Bacteroidetes bacterium]|nr:ATP-binding protein [Bacteroidota bacterium]
MELKNPFITAGYVSPDYFCDRDKERKIMVEALKNGRNLTLISPRKWGKTGLIKHAFYYLECESPQIAVFYIDVFFTRNLNEFVQLFAGAVLGKLDVTAKKRAKEVGKFFKSLRPVLTFDDYTGLPKISVHIDPAKEERSLQEIFDYLKASGKECYVAFDEFQQVAAYPEKGVEALLRSHIQFLPNVHFIFSGSKHHVMQEMFFSPKRPFYQSTQILSIDKIDREVYYQFASRFFGAKRPLTLEIFLYIYDEFEGHTWYIQMILNRLYGKKQKPDVTAVHRVITEIVAESEYLYGKLLASYSTVSVNLLKAIAKERCVKEINSGKFIAHYGLKATSSVNTALRKLIDKELVYKTLDGYIVYDRFMAIWLRQQPY